jgi:hypothetical protein
MERLNKFLDEASLWLIFPISWVLTCCLSWLVFFTIDYFCNNLYFFNGMTNIRHLTIIITLGIPFGLLFTIGIFEMTPSKKFWDYAKEVEKLIYEKNTLDELNLIYENEWEKLRKMYMGGANSSQRYELIRLRTMIEFKYEILNKLTHEQKI